MSKNLLKRGVYKEQDLCFVCPHCENNLSINDAIEKGYYFFDCFFHSDMLSSDYLIIN